MLCCSIDCLHQIFGLRKRFLDSGLNDMAG
jgi:hypothetical protein